MPVVSRQTKKVKQGKTEQMIKSNYQLTTTALCLDNFRCRAICLLSLMLCIVGCEPLPDDMSSLPAKAGSCGVAHYDSDAVPELLSNEYQFIRISYPIGCEDQSFAAVSLSSGWPILEGGIGLRWLEDRLVTHGFIVAQFMTIDDGYTTSTRNFERGHNAAIATLIAENSRLESPVWQMVDETKLGSVGYSRGGQGTLFAAATNSNLKAAVAINPWREPLQYPEASGVAIPTLFLTAERDTIALPSRVKKMFDSVMVEKMLINYRHLDHQAVSVVGVGGTVNPGMYSKAIVSYLKVYLDDDIAFCDYLTGSSALDDVLMGYFKDYDIANVTTCDGG